MRERNPQRVPQSSITDYLKLFIHIMLVVTGIYMLVWMGRSVGVGMFIPFARHLRPNVANGPQVGEEALLNDFREPLEPEHLERAAEAANHFVNDPRGQWGPRYEGHLHAQNPYNDPRLQRVDPNRAPVGDSDFTMRQRAGGGEGEELFCLRYLERPHAERVNMAVDDVVRAMEANQPFANMLNAWPARLRNHIINRAVQQHPEGPEVALQQVEELHQNPLNGYNLNPNPHHAQPQ